MSKAPIKINENDNRINSLDVIKRIEWLNSELDNVKRVDERIVELSEELETLSAFASDGEGLRGWSDGIDLINDGDMECYAKEYAQDLYGETALVEWPFMNIDWEQAADDLKLDMTCIEFDDTTFYTKAN